MTTKLEGGVWALVVGLVEELVLRLPLQELNIDEILDVTLDFRGRLPVSLSVLFCYNLQMNMA